MIDVTQCKLEDFFGSSIFKETTCFFSYPKDLGIKECDFKIEEGEFISCCIEITFSAYDAPDDFRVNMGAVVSEDNGKSLSDVDWHDMLPYINYSPTDIVKLLNSIKI